MCLLVASIQTKVQASSKESIAQHAASTDILALNKTDQIYHLNSAKQASGFFPIPADVSNKGLNTYLNNAQSFTTSVQPDFKKYSRYGMFIELENRSQASKWFLQVNHFLIEKTEIYTMANGEISITKVNAQNATNEMFSNNMLGRALPLEIPPNTKTKVLIVLTADDLKRPIYLGLMAAEKYQTWADGMDFLFTLVMGIVLCVVLFSLACFIITRDQTFLWFATSTSLILSLAMLRSPFVTLIFDPSTGIPDWLWIVVALTQVSILLLVKSFLSIQSGSKSCTIFNVAIGIALLTILISYPLSHQNNILVFSFSSVIVIGLVLSVGMVSAFKNGLINVIFMMGWLPIAISVGKSIYLSSYEPQLHQNTLSYYNVEGPFLQLAHFFIHFIAIVMRIVEIKKQHLAAQAQSSAKTNFLAGLSHDIRQPLDAMGLMLEHLDDVNSQNANEKSKQLTHKVKLLHKSMRDIFSALTDFTQIESGKLKVTKEATSLYDLFAELKDEHALAFQQKGIVFKVRSLDIVFSSDRTLLKRVLRNLLSNAHKFTKEGKVLLSARRKNGLIVIQVWDTGCGISADKQATIFDIYSQADEDGRRPWGNGVGLASVKHIAELLGLSICVDSQVQKGSVFSVYVPNMLKS